MKLRQLIEELAGYNPDAEVVVLGHSWVGSSEPEQYEDEPFVQLSQGKVVISA